MLIECGVDWHWRNYRDGAVCADWEDVDQGEIRPGAPPGELLTVLRADQEACSSHSHSGKSPPYLNFARPPSNSARCLVICCVNNSVAEMVTYLPISSPFIRFAGRFVNESFGVAAGWNFFVFVRLPNAYIPPQHPRTPSQC